MATFHVEKQSLELSSKFGKLVTGVLFLSNRDLANNLSLKQILQHVTDVVGTHSQLWISKTRPALDSRSLHGPAHRFQHGGPMSIADRAIEIPWNLRLVIGEWLTSSKAVHTSPVCLAQIGHGVETVEASIRVQASKNLALGEAP